MVDVEMTSGTSADGLEKAEHDGRFGSTDSRSSNHRADLELSHEGRQSSDRSPQPDTQLGQTPVPSLESPHPSNPTFSHHHHRNTSLQHHLSSPTNTYALLLPSPTLFSPSILSLLHAFYESYGKIRTWAPVRGLGRAIVVFEEEEEGGRACVEGGWFEIGGEVGGGEEVGERVGEGERLIHDSVKEQVEGTGGGSGSPSGIGRDYFTARRQTRKNSILIRLLPLPPTPLHLPPSHLLPPPPPSTNTLISPPGSPPEGWEPIEEEGPNKETLAEDLARALEEVRLNGRGFRKRRRRGSWVEEGDVDGNAPGMEEEDEQDDGNEIILETDDGVTFTVQPPPSPPPNPSLDPYPTSTTPGYDPTEEHHVYRNLPDEVYGGGMSGWRTPGLGGSLSRDGLGSGMSTPGGGRLGKVRTARPPLPGDEEK